MAHPIFKKTIFPFVRLFIDQVNGAENIPQKGPFILTSNHQTYLDSLLLSSVIIPINDKKIHFLASRNIFCNIIGDRLARVWIGCIPLWNGKDKAFMEMLSLVDKSEIVGIYIEGKKSHDGELNKGKTGIVKLALKSHTPILPIGLVGLSDLPKFKSVKLFIGQPIYLDKYYGHNIDEKLLRKLTYDVMHVISGLTKKPYNH